MVCQHIYIFPGTSGRNVPSIQVAVDLKLFYAVLPGQIGEGQQMVDMAVDAPVGEKSQQVERRVVFLHVVHSLEEGRIFEKGAVFDGLRYHGEILVDDPSGAYVEMSYLGIPHLPFGKADSQTAGLERRGRVL